MHVPDGFLDVPTSLATGVVSAGVVGLALTRVRREIGEAAAPMAGLSAAFVFAAQMINFPVGVGTSGHLLGGALAAALVGPWTAIVSMAVVLTVQALVFADGGVTAIGTNVLLMGIVAVGIGWGVTRAAAAVLPRRPASAAPAAALGALVSVPVSALVFVVLFAVGGDVPLDLGRLAQYMVSWHLLIGLGEAAITALVVGAVAAARPDLVHLVRVSGAYGRTLQVTAPDGTTREVTVEDEAPDAARLTRSVGRRAGAIGLAASLVVAGVLSAFASANPDGLEYVAGQLGFDTTARDSAVAGSPLGDYAARGIDNAWVATGVAGIVGVVVVLALTLLLARLTAARQQEPPAGSERVTQSSGA